MRSINLKYIAAVFAILGAQVMAGPCPEDHCSKVNAQLNEMCKADGKAGQPVYVPHSSAGYCHCPCSCFAVGSTVKTASGEFGFEELRKGDKVVTLAGSSEIDSVKRSDVVKHTVLRLTLSNNQTYTVSPNHAFLREGSVVTEASRLKVGDRVMGSEEEILTVKATAPVKNYTGPLFNLVLKGERASGDDKVYFSRGIASGDWTVQSYRDLLDAEVGLREVIKKANASERR